MASNQTNEATCSQSIRKVSDLRSGDKLGAVYYRDTCPTCTRAPDRPSRVYDSFGKVTSGCVDHFHGGHLITPSESARWHARPEAKRIRAASAAMRDGCVTEYAP